MDTHFEQTLPRPVSRPELSLPGEDEPPASLHLHAKPTDRIGAAESKEGEPEHMEITAAEPGVGNDRPDLATPLKPTRKRRSGLMAGVAVGVVAVAAAGVFLISPYNHILPVNLTALLAPHPAQPGASQHIDIPAPISPSANLARAKTPEPAPPHPAVVSAPPGLPGARPSDKRRAADVDEIFKLRVDGARETKAAAAADEDYQPSTFPGPARTSAAQPPSPTLPPPIAVAMNASEPAATPALLSLPTPTPPIAPVPVETTPAAAPLHDPVVSAATLQAAPMTSVQQVQVLNVVTELGVLLRNQRTENAQLRTDVAQMRERLDSQLGDYDRRLSLAEARGAINAAMGAGTTSPIPTAAPALIPLPTLTVTPAVRPSKAGAPPGAASSPDAPRRYRVQAASPGMAMLAELDRTGDVGNLLQVSIGDDVPGFGKVKSIAQQGAAWVLTAEHGTIR